MVETKIAILENLNCSQNKKDEIKLAILISNILLIDVVGI